MGQTTIISQAIGTALRELIIMVLAFALGGWLYAVLSFFALYAMNLTILVLTIHFRSKLCLPQ